MLFNENPFFDSVLIGIESLTLPLLYQNQEIQGLDHG